MGLTTRAVVGDKAERLLVLLHGLGANEHDLAGLAPMIDTEGYFVTICPRGQYAYGPGFSWYHFDDPALGPTTAKSSLSAIDEVIEESLRDYGFKRQDMIVGGFSQGGSMSLALAFRNSELPRPGGVLVMSGFLPPEGTVDFDWSGELPPVLMQHGTYDPMVQISRAREAGGVLTSNGVPVVFREYPMQHQVIPESARDAAEWLSQIRRGEKPAGIDVQISAPVEEGPVKSVNSATFQQEVLSSDKPVIVDFWAPWCAPCRQIEPIVIQIAKMREGSYKVVKCNIDECPDIAQALQIQSIPLVALFRNGKMERKSLGAKPRQQLEAELGMLVIP